jgi:hypothetical protein
MKRDHGFDASERMYKTRIKHWDLDKKAKANEMLHVQQIFNRRRAEDKETIVVVRGNIIDEA